MPYFSNKEYGDMKQTGYEDRDDYNNESIPRAYARTGSHRNNSNFPPTPMTSFNATAAPFILSLPAPPAPQPYNRPSNARITGFMEPSEYVAGQDQRATALAPYNEPATAPFSHSDLYLITRRPLGPSESLFGRDAYAGVGSVARRNNIVTGFVAADGSKTPEPDVVWDEPVKSKEEEVMKTKRTRRPRKNRMEEWRNGGGRGGRGGGNTVCGIPV